MNADFSLWADTMARRSEGYLTACLKNNEALDPRFSSALRYSVLAGGKRLRPLFVYAVADAFGCTLEQADVPAVSVELIHSYSLVHDDLPAMDDDRLRRGKPTTHCAYDEATAILVGDALQSLAFLLLTKTKAPLSDKQRLTMVAILAAAAGTQGMVGGQALDINATGRTLDESDLQKMHTLKTGALIKAAILLGATCSLSLSQLKLAQLSHLADLLGLAFQIRDDILDVETSSQISGKEQGKDARQGKATYVSLMGLLKAKARLQEVYTEAQAELKLLQLSSSRLSQLTDFVIMRES